MKITIPREQYPSLHTVLSMIWKDNISESVAPDPICVKVTEDIDLQEANDLLANLTMPELEQFVYGKFDDRLKLLKEYPSLLPVDNLAQVFFNEIL